MFVRTQLAALAGAVLIAPVAVLPAPAQAATPSCHGHPATIVGTPGSDLLEGTDGDDVIVGGAGDDSIVGDGGHDVICGNRGRDRLDGGDGPDTVFGERGNDHLTGGSGNDHLRAGPGRWTSFFGDAGNDVWISRTPEDRLFFRLAPDGVRVDLQAGTASGWGEDTFSFGNAALELTGSFQSDTLLGTSRDDSIVGDGGHDDTIRGREGNDVITTSRGTALGGPGDDVLVARANGPVTVDGGEGNDIFEIYEGDTQVLGGSGGDHVDLFLQGPGVSLLSSRGSVDGGPGTDGLSLVDEGSTTGPQVYDHVVYDMAGGTMAGDGTVEPVTGFEDFAVDNIDSDADTSYDVMGTDGPNDIGVNRTSGTVVIHGAGGDDSMNGSLADDTFDGGAGQDAADGEGGTDTCTSVEEPSRCEVVNP
jgi:Ca2+-binding RTX toxin-like protein